jgi:hypothetical protein
MMRDEPTQSVQPRAGRQAGTVVEMNKFNLRFKFSPTVVQTPSTG